MTQDKHSQNSGPNTEQQSRRDLLRMSAYIPPAMLGVMIAGNKIARAATTVGRTKNCGAGGTIVVSAGGMACCPCVPTSNQYNLNRCNLTRCQLGHCASCKLVAFSSVNQCKQKVARGGCTCTCTPINARQKNGPATCV